MSIATPSDLIAAIESVVGSARRPLPLHEPLFQGREEEYVGSCIRDGWVSSVGAFVDRFERDLASFCGAKHAVVMVNGTCALHLALVALGVQAGDEVLVPSLTFVATANAVSHAGAVPHFVDSEERSFGIDPEALRAHLKAIATMRDGKTVNKHTGARISALVPVHVFGHPCQTQALKAVADEFGMIFVEDATEALGSTQDGAPVGSQHTAVFSFNGNKIITTGGGGAVVTNDAALHARIKHLSTTAKQPHAWAFSHDEVAWNYRLPNLNAAMGCAQLEQLPRFVQAKRALATRYMAAFADVPGVQVQAEPEGTQSNYWLVALLADKGGQEWLEVSLAQLHAAGLLCRPTWTPLHLLPMYAGAPRAALPVAESLAQRIINLPSSVALGLAYV